MAIVTNVRAHVLLAGIKEFKKLPQTDLEAIAHVCQWHRYQEGEEIVRYHGDSNSVFFITQGEMRVTFYSMSGKEVILCYLPAGEIFGELTAIDGQSRSATVVAETSSLVASISSLAFLELIFNNRQIALAILQRLTGQIRRLTERVFESSTLNVRNRIFSELLRLAKKHPMEANRVVISPAPIQADLASLIGTVRETVSRELADLEREQVILQQDHAIHILDMAKLTEMVENVRGNL